MCRAGTPAQRRQGGRERLAARHRERQRQELEFRSSLGAVLQAVNGFAAPEAGHAYTRARELWEQLGFPSEFLLVPFGQSLYHVFHGELDVALRLDEDLLRLSRQRDDSAGLVLGYVSSGRNLMYKGRFAASRSHLEAGLAVYDPESHRSLVQQAGIYPHVNSQAYLGIALFCLGYSDQALRQSNEAIAEARRLAHLPTLAMSLTVGIVLLLLIGDDPALDTRVDQLGCGSNGAGFFPLARTGSNLSRLDQGQTWGRGGGRIAPSQRFRGLPCHWLGDVVALRFLPSSSGV